MTANATIATVPWLSPQQKRVVDELRRRGERGLTTLEASLLFPAITVLSQRVNELRKMEVDGKPAYEISGQQEGKHIRYRLLKEPRPGVADLIMTPAGVEKQATF